MRKIFFAFLSIVPAFVFQVLNTPEACARVIIGGGVVVGAPYYSYPPYYAYYPPYPYPPAYPYPYGAPPPAPAYSYTPPPASQQDRYFTANNGEYCREYRHSVVIEGQRQQAFGHACRQPDGSWRIVD